LWWPSLTEDIQTDQLLCWSDMTDTEYSTTSSSNEEEQDVKVRKISMATKIVLFRHLTVNKTHTI